MASWFPTPGAYDIDVQKFFSRRRSPLSNSEYPSPTFNHDFIERGVFDKIWYVLSHACAVWYLHLRVEFTSVDTSLQVGLIYYAFGDLGIVYRNTRNNRCDLTVIRVTKLRQYHVFPPKIFVPLYSPSSPRAVPIRTCSGLLFRRTSRTDNPTKAARCRRDRRRP